MLENLHVGQACAQLEYTFTWPRGPSHVNISGDFGLTDTPDWTQIPLEWNESDCCFKKTLRLTVPRNLSFKFVVDGNWFCRPDIETRPDSSGNVNNFISLEQSLQRQSSEDPSQKNEIQIEKEINVPSKHQDATMIEKVDFDSQSTAINSQLKNNSKSSEVEASEPGDLTPLASPKLRIFEDEYISNKRDDEYATVKSPSISAYAPETVNKDSKENEQTVETPTVENTVAEISFNKSLVVSSLDKTKGSGFSHMVASDISSTKGSIQERPLVFSDITFDQSSLELKLPSKVLDDYNPEFQQLPFSVTSEDLSELATKPSIERGFVSETFPKNLSHSAASNTTYIYEITASGSKQAPAGHVEQTMPCNIAKFTSQSKGTVELDLCFASGILFSDEKYFEDNHEFLAKFV